MSRQLTIAEEARWVSRSPIPAGDIAEQLAILDDLIAHLDAACRLGSELEAQRFALTLEADRLAAREMRIRLARRESDR